MRHSRAGIAAALLACVAALAGCVSLAGAARDSFSAAHACPADRVQVTDEGPAAASPPPEDVARDPERTRLWNQAHAGPPPEVFEAHGCGLREIYHCRHGTGDEGEIGICLLAPDQPPRSPEETERERRALERGAH